MRFNSGRFVSIAILLGGFAFMLSVFILKCQITTDQDALAILYSDTTRYDESLNGSNDTLYVYSIQKNQVESNSKDTIISKDQLSIVSKLDKHKIPIIEEGSRKFFFNRFPGLMLWIMMISIAIGFSAFITPFLFVEIIRFSRSLHWSNWVASTLISVLLLAFLFVPQGFEMSNPKSSLLLFPKEVIDLLGYGVSAFGLFFNLSAPFIGAVFWLILVFNMNAFISKLANNLDNPKVADQLLEVQINFEKYFIIIALLLAYTIICTRTFISAYNTMLNSDPSQPFFPVEFSLMNGLMQTFILTLIYLGITFNFNYIKEAINKSPHKHKINPLSLQALNKEKQFPDILKIILTILAPLIGNGLQDLLKFF